MATLTGVESSGVTVSCGANQVWTARVTVSRARIAALPESAMRSTRLWLSARSKKATPMGARKSADAP